MGSDDPTDGMGHCVFADEVDRAYFGMFSFFTLSSWPFKELTLISFILQVLRQILPSHLIYLERSNVCRVPVNGPYLATSTPRYQIFTLRESLGRARPCHARHNW